jgi:hypothetical protein
MVRSAPYLAVPVAVALLGSTLAGCGLDRSGLEGTFGGGGSPSNVDAAFETITIIAEDGRTGAGGAASEGGAGGDDLDDGGQPGSGGSGSGGVSGGGAGGTGVGGATGVGGQPGVGGTMGVGGRIGTGGAGVGGMGTGGMGTGGCNSLTCPTGCCMGSTCVPTPTAQRCGRAGVQCQTCAPCERCSGAGACEVDPESHWDLSAVSAILNAADPHNKPNDGTDWDLEQEPVGGPLPDPFCELDQFVASSVQVVGQAPALIDTITPNWSAALAPERPLLHPEAAPIRAGDLMPGGPAWLIWIGDDDGGSLFPSGETVCQIDGPLTTADFRAGGFMRNNVDSCASATFKLTCHP